MYSFYGGRPGNSFIIITTYRSINDMVERFKQGPDYTVVHYDEYVMINTINKNDPDNGKLYRRGYDFTNDMGGAEYVGAVVGPAGVAPFLALTTIDDAKSKEKLEQYESRSFEGELSLPNGGLVPGKIDTDEGPVFNDKIKYFTCSIRTPDNQECTAYIGLSLPYTIMDCESKSVEPYTEAGQYVDNASIKRIDDLSHPFYEKFRMTIPKGIKGDSIKYIQVQIANEDIIYPPTMEDKKADDIANHRQILVYRYENYDNDRGGTPKKIYLGDYNIVEDIQLDKQGNITIQYSYQDDKQLENSLRWIDSVLLNPSTGLFKITYNQKDNEGQHLTYEQRLDWVKNITVTDDGRIIFHHTTGDIVDDHWLKWITDTQLRNDGILQITYNTGEIYRSPRMRWIADTQLEDNGTLKVTYSDGESYKDQKIRWLTDVRLKNDGTLGFKYNFKNGDPQSEEDKWQDIPTKLRWPIHVDMNEDQKIEITWSDGAVATIEHGINSIDQMAVDGNHLLVLYTDPEKRGKITYQEITGWTDLGAIEYEYRNGSVASNLSWVGVGKFVNDGSDNKKIIFNISPTYFIDKSVNQIIINAGYLEGNNGIDTVRLNMVGRTNVTRTFTGLQFVIDSGISSSAATGDFINLSIENMELLFNTVQG